MDKDCAALAILIEVKTIYSLPKRSKIFSRARPSEARPSGKIVSAGSPVLEGGQGLIL